MLLSEKYLEVGNIGQLGILGEIFQKQNKFLLLLFVPFLFQLVSPWISFGCFNWTHSKTYLFKDINFQDSEATNGTPLKHWYQMAEAKLVWILEHLTKDNIYSEF